MLLLRSLTIQALGPDGTTFSIGSQTDLMDLNPGNIVTLTSTSQSLPSPITTSEFDVILSFESDYFVGNQRLNWVAAGFTDTLVVSSADTTGNIVDSSAVTVKHLSQSYTRFIYTLCLYIYIIVSKILVLKKFLHN